MGFFDKVKDVTSKQLNNLEQEIDNKRAKAFFDNVKDVTKKQLDNIEQGIDGKRTKDIFEKVQDKTKKQIDNIEQAIVNKSNEALQKAKELKEEYYQHQIEQKEDRLNIKEEKLKKEEKMLTAYEKRLIIKQIELQAKEDELKTKENRPKYVFYACALVGGLIYFVLTIDLSQIDYISNDIRTKVNYISEDITAKMNVNAINDTNDSSAVTIKPGVYYVKVNVLEERLAPSSTASITNRIYRKQKLDVYEVRNGWARVSKFYDGSVEGKTGQVARWVNTQGLSAYQ